MTLLEAKTDGGDMEIGIGYVAALTPRDSIVQETVLSTS